VVSAKVNRSSSRSATWPTRRTFGPNYERLAAIKRRYDPTNMFRFNQNIEPA
jgi:FAD/FMN-containing dehydrogenase